jgi:predicted Rossmann fold nucleotide-binding protein DprA/Smf involved in DNA uptake
MIKKRKPSDATRSERRRVSKIRQMTRRQQRWRDACLVFESGLQILNQSEDEYIILLFKNTINKINKYLEKKQSDEQIIINAIKSGAWTVSELADETGLSNADVQKILKNLCNKNTVKKENNLYKPII